MPTPTPVSLIKPLNRLFGSIDITIAPNNASMSFGAQQLPSTYYMDDTNAFLRLRPLHRSGFGMFERATRVVGLYVGNWDGNAATRPTHRARRSSSAISAARRRISGLRSRTSLTARP